MGNINISVEKEIVRDDEREAYLEEKVAFVVERMYGFSKTDDRITDYDYKELCGHIRNVLIEAREFDMTEYGRYMAGLYDEGWEPFGKEKPSIREPPIPVGREGI